jgi:hypothetical protein
MLVNLFVSNDWIGGYMNDSMVNNNEDGGHVVAADARVGVGGQQEVQHVLGHLLCLLLLEVLLHHVDQSLAVLHVLLPDAVASHQDELVLASDFELLYVWVTGDHLLVEGQRLVLLVVEVGEGPREVESSVDPAHRDVPARLLDARLLLGRVRLVVLAEVDGLAVPAEGGAGVAGVGHEVGVGRDQHHVGGAPHCSSDELAVGLASLLLHLAVAVADVVELLLSFRTLNHLVDAAEGLLQRLLVVFLLVGIAALQLVLEDCAHVLADFEA